MFKRSISILTGVILALGLTSAIMVAEKVYFETHKSSPVLPGYERYIKGDTIATRFYRDNKNGGQDEYYSMSYDKSDDASIKILVLEGGDRPVLAYDSDYLPKKMFLQLKAEYEAQQKHHHAVHKTHHKRKKSLSDEEFAIGEYVSLPPCDEIMKVCPMETEAQTKITIEKPTKGWFKLIKEKCLGCSCSAE